MKESPQPPPRRIYSVFGVPPEIQAYAMAKYSRSSQGMLESIGELSQERAEQFLRTFYFDYGHRSIADLAHLVFALEQVSILAAIEIVDEQLWDGQERSTRYQPFRKTGWYVPDAIGESASFATYQQTAQGLFTVYQDLAAELLERLVASVPRPDSLPEHAFRRTLRARAFDVARGLLPLATHTSIGQVVSARTLERQISRLLASRYAEVQSIGAELRMACERPAEAPLLDRIVQSVNGDGLGAAEDLLRPPAAPTLVRYTAPAAYRSTVDAELDQAADTYLARLGAPDRRHAVQLAEPALPRAELAATLLYAHARAGHSYRQVQRVVDDLTEAELNELVDLSLRARGAHDDLLREHQVGYGLVFDVLIDLGSFRDLHRHRRCVQVRQPYTWAHAFEPVEDVFRAGLGDEVALGALEGGLGETYVDTLLRAEQAAASLDDPLAGTYLLPLAYRTRCLFKMDWAEAAYLIEQRTAPAGHFSYRRIAWAMYQALRERDAKLAEPIRAQDPTQAFDLLIR
ncbi:MAG: FAD-dependent thymidylate synthase [Chloroflexi bacterium]|nr:FAD-dependent thymidylate synthase [Chloroflexota bacterium]